MNNSKNNNNKNINQENLFFHSKIIIADGTKLFPGIFCYIIDNQVLQTFSHFSYQISGGELLITDFKKDNIKRLVTDYKIYKVKNGGYKNILEFFSSHICNEFCKTLKLSHPRKKNDYIQNGDGNFFSMKFLSDFKLCKCCSIPCKNTDICAICSADETNKRKKVICKDCGVPFFYSVFVYNTKIMEYPIKCPKCNSNF